jgi:hypothetical protein
VVEQRIDSRRPSCARESISPQVPMFQWVKASHGVLLFTGS